MPIIMPYKTIRTTPSNQDITRNYLCVYRYQLDNRPIYIGLTTQGIVARNRLHIRDNTFISYVDSKLRSLDDLIIVIHRCQTKRHMRLFEQKLIGLYHPPCNTNFRGINAKNINF